MKNLSLFFFIVILAGCEQRETDDQPLKLEIIKEEQLKFSRETAKEFIPNPDSAKFRNQIGECGEVSYKEADSDYVPFQRFIVLSKDIVLVENQTDQKQFELSWRSACTPSWK